jgi:tripartite-type tricarboxylate transporter receptor subunit TctC
MELVAKAPPDGYTIVMGNSAPMVLNPSLYSKLPYDPIRDFAPITLGLFIRTS